MVHGKNRIPCWIDRRLTGLAGPDYADTISFGLPFEPEDSQYGEYRFYPKGSEIPWKACGESLRPLYRDLPAKIAEQDTLAQPKRLGICEGERWWSQPPKPHLKDGAIYHHVCPVGWVATGPTITRRRPMSDEGQTSQFVDRIVEQTLQALAEDPVFDCKTSIRLKELAKSSGWTNDQQVVEALRARQGE